MVATTTAEVFRGAATHLVDPVLRAASSAAVVTDPRVGAASDAEARKVEHHAEVASREAAMAATAEVVPAVEGLRVVAVEASLAITALSMRTCCSTGTRLASRTSAMRRRPSRRPSSTASSRSTTRVQTLQSLELRSLQSDVKRDSLLVRVLK